jgi:hypothetical protein
MSGARESAFVAAYSENAKRAAGLLERLERKRRPDCAPQAEPRTLPFDPALLGGLTVTFQFFAGFLALIAAVCEPGTNSNAATAGSILMSAAAIACFVLSTFPPRSAFRCAGCLRKRLRELRAANELYVATCAEDASIRSTEVTWAMLAELYDIEGIVQREERFIDCKACARRPPGRAGCLPTELL